LNIELNNFTSRLIGSLVTGTVCPGGRRFVDVWGRTALHLGSVINFLERIDGRGVMLRGLNKPERERPPVPADTAIPGIP
jgi:hypothetical protein